MTDEVMQNGRYDHSNWMTKKFVGDGHSEEAWAKRLDIPLVFLIGKD